MLNQPACPLLPASRHETFRVFYPVSRGEANPHVSLLASTAVGTCRPTVGQIEPALTTFHPMESQRPIQPLPQVAILDGHHLPEKLPSPAVAPPLGQPVLHSVTNIGATADQGHVRGLVEGLQGANDGQQVEPFSPNLGLHVGHFELLGAVRPAEREPPSARFAA